MLTGDYETDVLAFGRYVRAEENFDIVRHSFSVGPDEMTVFYIDGFVKDEVIQRLLQYLIDQEGIAAASAREFCRRGLPYGEVSCHEEVPELAFWLLSGGAVFFGSRFGASAVVVDARTYPARQPEEPESDRVMQGAKDGFVETLLFNTVLLRRRLRDPRLTMRHLTLKGPSGTDVVVAYMDGVASAEAVEDIVSRLKSLRPKSLTMGYRSLVECLIPHSWYNPFPKVRTLERPDAAAAHLAEGSILVLCDTTAQVLVLPTSFFDFFQESDDYYFPPLTGTYLRILRQAVLLLSLFLVPLWYLLVGMAEHLPPWLAFVLPEELGAIPLILQLFLAEFAIDGLKLASMNTPDRLSNSMSVVGALILGDVAVEVGWLSPDVILYMSIVAVAGFTQQNYEMGYSFKFMRMGTLLLTALGGVWGLLFGIAAVGVLLATTPTINYKKGYLYPLIPFRPRELLSVFLRLPKAQKEREVTGKTGKKVKTERGRPNDFGE